MSKHIVDELVVIKNAIELWQEYRPDELEQAYHSDFTGHHNTQIFNYDLLAERYQYYHKRYTNIRLTLMGQHCLDNGLFHILLELNAIDVEHQCIVELYITHVLQIKQNKIKQLWSISKQELIVDKCQLMQTEDLSLEKQDKQRFLSALQQVDRAFGDSVKMTSRERDVLFFIFRGYSAKEIGLKMKVSYRTVQKHLENIRTKYQINNLSQLRKIFKI